MNQQDHILKELRDISPAVAGISKVNVFSVPHGYFETLTGVLLAGTSQPAVQATVPHGYFDNLAGSILQRIRQEEAVEETALPAVLQNIGSANVFTVPQGYFENLSAQVISKLPLASATAMEETAFVSEVVGGIGNRNVFSAPDGYFDNLQQDILQKLAQPEDLLAETAAISPLVAGIGRSNVYSVPAGYFEKLPEAIQGKNKPVAKVISMQSRGNMWRYAAAAVVTGIIAISAFFMLQNNNNNNASSQVALMKQADTIIETNSFDKELNSISDAAIVEFLEDNGEDVEASLVASLVDDSNLPAAEEFLLNEQALDDILKTLDLNN